MRPKAIKVVKSKHKDHHALKYCLLPLRFSCFQLPHSFMSFYRLKEIINLITMCIWQFQPSQYAELWTEIKFINWREKKSLPWRIPWHRAFTFILCVPYPPLFTQCQCWRTKRRKLNGLCWKQLLNFFFRGNIDSFINFILLFRLICFFFVLITE